MEDLQLQARGDEMNPLSLSRHSCRFSVSGSHRKETEGNAVQEIETEDQDIVVESSSFPFVKNDICYRRCFGWTIVVRLVLIFRLVPPHVVTWLQSPSIQFVLVNPVFTLRHVREAAAIRTLFVSHSARSSTPTASPTTSTTFPTSTLHFRHAYRLESIHLPPLLLALLEHSPVIRLFDPSTTNQSKEVQEILFGLLLLLIDWVMALLWERLAVRAANQPPPHQHQSQEQQIPVQIRPRLLSRALWIEKDYEGRMALGQCLACFYFCNPVTILAASVYHSFQNLPVLALLGAIYSLLSGYPLVLSSFLLALSSYVHIHNVLFVIPLALFVRHQQHQHHHNDSREKNHRMKELVYCFVLYFVSLHMLSFALVGDDCFLSVLVSTTLYPFRLFRSTSSSALTSVSMSPHLSPLWYVSMQLFYRFRLFYTLVLALVPYIVIIPAVLRLHPYPKVLLTFFWMINVVFVPPCTLYPLVVGMCFAGLSPVTLAWMFSTPCVSASSSSEKTNQNSPSPSPPPSPPPPVRIVLIIVMGAIPVPLVLCVLTHRLWLETGTGDANFLFFQCLAYSAFVGYIGLISYIGAALARDKADREQQRLSKSITGSNDRQQQQQEEKEGKNERPPTSYTNPRRFLDSSTLRCPSPAQVGSKGIGCPMINDKQKNIL